MTEGRDQGRTIGIYGGALMYKKIRWIISFIVLAVLSLALPVSCDQMPTPDGGGDGNGGNTARSCNITEDGVAGEITDVDADDDGLIDIHNLDMFDNIRCNLAGTELWR